MRLAEFNELCDREWTGHGPMDFRDVVGLHLTGPSAAELAAEAFGNGSGVELPDGAARAALKAAVSAGARLTTAVNPVTRSVVTIEVGEEPETVTVKRGPETLTTPIG